MREVVEQAFQTVYGDMCKFFPNESHIAFRKSVHKLYGIDLVDPTAPATESVTPRFKVGDRVRLIKSLGQEGDAEYIPKGTVGVITRVFISELRVNSLPYDFAPDNVAVVPWPVRDDEIEAA